MADRSLRGIRLGASSLQSEEGVVFHERVQHIYSCTSCGRDSTLTFAADAEPPQTWECRTCGAEAVLRVGDGTVTVDHSGDKAPRSHWDMLLERRSIPELEELLEERLAFVRARRGAGDTDAKLSA
ncbi:MAG: RNA polymerase-binding protein RbpA [Microbacterium sp.]|uniref:RNA polymerase-binding protein RbpA n=1 Tax=Microbacterium sp. TaxID=51671 RepID=UPI001ACC28A8|nr:RNA polymerase-binding protein RbpA [Microbacterium sp.]MBN9152621.1 RNA polymerase-binding protein RbpA [Microbacterium sp.]MBN9171460.1 RNA polymerase-binding protein RbpA [Microbacterium sp.]MBN9174785.1 RNA polymerase-binding protein RbpA [Microbacterium sp.]MBN9179983.1 RNA polymerase-binding protein RbpA [Microbacterium sp.]MBN9186389.1 RNA polymerase-binding protein RbpA [Microbacterium sp.]